MGAAGEVACGVIVQLLWTCGLIAVVWFIWWIASAPDDPPKQEKRTLSQYGTYQPYSYGYNHPLDPYVMAKKRKMEEQLKQYAAQRQEAQEMSDTLLQMRVTALEEGRKLTSRELIETAMQFLQPSLHPSQTWEEVKDMLNLAIKNLPEEAP